jgi:putative flippase GtrA
MFALTRQLFLFLVIGAVQVLLDSSVFVLLSLAGLPVAPSNVAGRICGACLGFYLNGRFTFADAGRPRLDKAHLGRFIVAWLLLTALGTVLLVCVERQFDLRAAWLAKPAVEAFLAAIGFVVWRQWVFR